MAWDREHAECTTARATAGARARVFFVWLKLRTWRWTATGTSQHRLHRASCAKLAYARVCLGCEASATRSRRWPGVGSTQSALLPAPRTWSRGGDPRVTPKPQYKGAWQSAEALLQFSIDVYGAHRPEGLDHNVRVTNFRPAVFNEPIAAAVQHLHTEVDDDDLAPWPLTLLVRQTWHLSSSLRPCDPAAGRLIVTSSATTACSLGEVIRQPASRQLRSLCSWPPP